MISNTDFKAIAELDLDPIKVKLMHKESGEGWTLEYANQMEFEYRRFLYLMKMFPNEQAAPLFDVDIFWHYHILDTMKYAVDCEEVFGFFLHHFPYLGLRGEDDEEAHRQGGANMQRLYEDTFGEPYIREAEPAAAAAGSTAEANDAASAMKTAWSIRASETAWSIRASTPATTAWSIRAASPVKTAWSIRASTPAKTAWSIRASTPAKTAWSIRASTPAKTAWSIRASTPGKTAWSIRAATDSAANHALDRFNSERPTLAAA